MRKLIFLITAFLPLLSCSDSPVDLSEYQGKNYIESSNLASVNWISDDPVEGAYHYMGLNTDSAGASILPLGIATFTGLPGNSDTGDISRLEVFNLVPDGGFESGTAGWDNNGTGATFVQNNGDAERVHDDAGNDSLKITIPVEADILRFNLSTLNDSFVADKNYIIRLFFTKNTTNDTIILEYNNGAGSPILSPYKTWSHKVKTGWNDDLSAYTKFPDDDNLNTNITAAAGAMFCINSFDSTFNKIHNLVYIDDFRIIRSDQEYFIRLTVPYSESGRPDLYSGIYRFSVYVKGEEDTDVTPNQNRFRSPRISLGINNEITGFSSSSYSNTAWTQLSVEKFIQISEGDSIELKLSPADFTTLPNSLDIGSVLIASPSLYYISD